MSHDEIQARSLLGSIAVGERVRPFYIPIKYKFAISFVFSAVWLLLSTYIARPWVVDLSRIIGFWPAFVVILFVALIPGFLNMLLLSSLLLDSPPPLKLDIDYPQITLLVAAFDEEKTICETMRGIRGQDYPGAVDVIVVDDGSTDRTVPVLRSLNMPNLKVVEAEHGGKANALTKGLDHVENELVVTIDADTFLHPQALRRIVARFLSDPNHTAAVAGCVLAKNSRDSWLAKLQEWDYFTAISSVKRQQALYQGTLVAQGAFSAFRARKVRETGGWPNVIGEDIVMTWDLIKRGYRIGFEPTAIGFTQVPATFKGFYRQRKRWARGMIEGLKHHGNLMWKSPSLAAFFVGLDLLFPLLDSFYTLVFLPGVALALSGYFYIAGPLTLLVLPLTVLIILAMIQKQKKIFDLLGLKIRRNRLGILGYILIYQAIMSPICLVGYTQEAIGLTKRW